MLSLFLSFPFSVFFPVDYDNVVIVGRFFNKGSWCSESWRREHPDEFEDDHGDPPGRMATAAERREVVNIVRGPVSTVGVRSSGTPPPHSARLTSAEGVTLILHKSGPINQHN